MAECAVPVAAKKEIKEIIVEGNKHIKTEAILRRIPFKKGSFFDPNKTGEAINHLYGLGYFDQIKIEQESIDEKTVKIYIVVDERKLLEKISFEGNRALSSRHLSKELNIDKIETIDEEQLQRIADAIKKLYKDEHFHGVEVDYKVVKDKDRPDKGRVIFSIIEGKKSKIKRVYFRGNKKIPDRKLRTVIYTREDWLLGIMDDSGKYDEEAFEVDKKRVEFYYRDLGYLMAKVVSADVEFSKDETEITVTFDIKEGDVFLVRYITVPGDNIFAEDELIDYVTLEQGKPFSQSKLVTTINRLKAQWAEVGYVHADVYPQVVPNEETKEVDITFHAEKGKKMFINRINITGNKVTKDRVIRRELAIEEGDLITGRKMSESRRNVEYLGFFEKDSVNWRVHKLAEDRADLELQVKEAKTNKLNAGLSYGGDRSRTFRGNVQFQSSNFFGRGFDIGFNVQASKKRFESGSIFYFDPHFLDTDVSTALSVYMKKQEYEQWRNVNPIPVEDVIGASARVGFLLPSISRRTQISISSGIEHVKHNDPVALPYIRAVFQPIVDRTFEKGDLIWLGVDLSKDTRNHRVYPSEGYKFLISVSSAPPLLNDKFSYIKTELDWSWYTPLIGEDSLVLMLHTHAGMVDAITSNKIIPYKELFHMGGQNTVRGFQFGAIGPAWQTGDPLGARKAFQFNTELIFPLVPDYHMKGHFFYDAGAGWDTPKRGLNESSYIKRDKFNLRHAVGFGLNLTQPFPAKIDWGYKLDRDKKAGEAPHEFHISMNTAW